MIIRPNPGFIIPTRRFVDVGMPQAKVCAAGRYQLHWVENGVRTGQQTPWFDNIILDSGLNRWGTGAIIAGAAIGTGAATPLATDTGLQTQTHYTTTPGTGHNAITAAGVSPYNNTRTFVFRTTLGALDGSYTEVGAGWASGSMFSRALILDGDGVATSISVSAAQQLDIVYQLSVYPPLTDTGPTVVTISGVNYNVTGRASNVNSTTTWSVQGAFTPALSNMSNGLYTYEAIGAITANPTGTSGTVSASVTTDSYTTGTYTKTGLISFGLTGGNRTGGAGATLAPWNGLGTLQYGFDPFIPKDATKTLVLNVSVSWGRRP